MALSPKQKTLPIDLQKEGVGKWKIKKKKGFMRMKDDSEPTGGPFPIFCGGMSKAYKK
jgi:hypothetical protein